MDKIKELREASARLIAYVGYPAYRSDVEFLANYVRSILNSPDEAAVERAAGRIGAWIITQKHVAWPASDYADLARAALTAALGVAAPDGGRSNEDSGRGEAACSVGSCQRHGRCMYLNHPRCPLNATPTDQPGDGAEDVVERLMDEAYQSADCPAGGPYALSWEQAKYMVRAAFTSTAVVPGMVMVPRRPTDQMQQAGSGYIWEEHLNHEAKCDAATNVYRAMIAAAELAVPTPEGE